MKRIPVLAALVLITTRVFAGHQSVVSGEDKDFLPNPILTLTPTKIESPVRIDGTLEDVWYSGAAFENFSENYPTERGRPLVETEGFVLYDKDNLYVAFISHDPDIAKLRAHLSDRDRIFRDDFVGVNIDPYGAQVNGFEFFVNPLGIQGDLSVDVTGNEDESFDAVWESAASIGHDRWIVEMKIPFQSLRFPNKDQQTWLIHLLRIYPRENRFVYSWMPHSRDVSNQYAEAGRLQLSLGHLSKKTVELLPYVASSSSNQLVAQEDGVNGKWDHTDFDHNVGLNLKYGLSSTMTLDVAYNPDFSQIEADAGQINVNNTFALFFNEKRPFFLEGRDIFFVDPDVNLLYTRSINDPLVTGKITGKVGKISLGYVSAFDENTPYVVPFEERSVTLATKANSTSNVLRTKVELGTGTYIGFVGTDRRTTDGSNSVGTIDTKIRLNKQYTLSAMAGVSRTDEPTDSAFSEDRIPDVSFHAGDRDYNSDFNGERFNGHFMRVTLDRTARHWGFFAWYNDLSPGFRSENGFIRGNNLREAGAFNRYTFYLDESHPWLSRIEPRVQMNRKYNYDGKLKDFWIGPQLFIQMKKQTYFWSNAAVVNNENFRGKQFNHIHRAAVEMGTEAFRLISGGFWTETGSYVNRGGTEGDPRNPLAKAKGYNLSVWLTLKPTSQLSNEFEYRQFNLWTHYGGKLLVGQQIYRDALAYQFTKRLFLRLIGEISYVDFYDGDSQQVEHRTRFSVDPLLSYKINPFTVLFLGAHVGGGKDPYENYDGLTRTNQSVFVKFQYFMRI